MTGTSFLVLILISMGWLFYFLGLALKVPLLTGVVGSVTAFFSVPMLGLPWPWLWILLPLAIDPYWLGKVLRKP